MCLFVDISFGIANNNIDIIYYSVLYSVLGKYPQINRWNKSTSK